MRNWAQNLLCAKGRYGMIGFRLLEASKSGKEIDDNVNCIILDMIKLHLLLSVDLLFMKSMNYFTLLIQRQN